MRRLYVVDTSVLIHDPNCISQFVGNDVGIPIFVIIELDDLKEKRHKQQVAFASRIASRNLQTISNMGSGDLHEPEGVYLEEQDIRIRTIGTTRGVGIKALQDSNNPRKMDLWILESALAMQEDYEEVVLVSKDLNLRLLALAEGLEAQDYETDKVSIDTVYTGFEDIGEYAHTLDVYDPEAQIPAKDFIEDVKPNQFIICHKGNESKKMLLRNVDGIAKPVPKSFPKIGIEPKNIEQRMAVDLLMNPEISLITMVGKAGTGKTFLALAAAVAQLYHTYDKILLSKPVVDMGNSIGYLPGDLQEKMQPWMTSYFDNLDQLIPTDTDPHRKTKRNWNYLMDTGLIEIQPLNSIRGRSIPNSFMIIDEAQNLTPHQVKTLVTRAAEGTKVVLCGDPFQVDAQFLDQNSNGLTYVTHKMSVSELFGTVFFSEGIRSRLSEEAANYL